MGSGRLKNFAKSCQILVIEKWLLSNPSLRHFKTYFLLLNRVFTTVLYRNLLENFSAKSGNFMCEKFADMSRWDLVAVFEGKDDFGTLIHPIPLQVQIEDLSNRIL